MYTQARCIQVYEQKKKCKGKKKRGLCVESELINIKVRMRGNWIYITHPQSLLLNRRLASEGEKKEISMSEDDEKGPFGDPLLGSQCRTPLLILASLLK